MLISYYSQRNLSFIFMCMKQDNYGHIMRGIILKTFWFIKVECLKHIWIETTSIYVPNLRGRGGGGGGGVEIIRPSLVVIWLSSLHRHSFLKGKAYMPYCPFLTNMFLWCQYYKLITALTLQLLSSDNPITSFTLWEWEGWIQLFAFSLPVSLLVVVE